MAVQMQGKSPVPFEVIDRDRAADLFDAPKAETKWGAVVDAILAGKHVFIEGMTRSQRETLRSIVKYRRYGVLRSRTVTQDGVTGMVIRLDRGMKGK
jgi:hypothetical protein